MIEQEAVSSKHDAREVPDDISPHASKVKLTLFEERHLEQVLRLYGQVFGQEATVAFQARYRWAQQDNIHPHDTPKWVLVFDNRVVGFLTTIPLSYSVAGNVVVAHTPCDYMVHPAYRFHGIKLMREFLSSCENCVDCAEVRATIKVNQWLGVKPVGRLIHYVKVLDGRFLGLRDRWNKLPSPLWWPVTQALRLAGWLRLRDIAKGAVVNPLEDFDQRFDRFYLRLSQLVPITVVRDLHFLQWRYGSASPHAGREIGVIADGDGELIGYVVFYLSKGPAHQGYIFDLQVLPPENTEAAGALLAYAVEQLRSKGAWTVRYHQLSSPFALPSELLRRCGFIQRGRHWFMVRFGKADLAAIAEQQENWNYSYGDSEASHACI